MKGFTLKGQTRVLGVDDGPYIRGSSRTILVLTVYRLDRYIDGIMTAEVATDGDDSSEVIAEMLNRSRFKEQVRCIVSDGACLAGFNVLDMDDLHERAGVPVVTCSDEEPDTASIGDALRAAFGDRDERLSLITAHRPVRLELKDGPCWVRKVGIGSEDAEGLVRKCTIHGRTPEPIRISHLLAKALYEHIEVGYSRGK